MARRVSSQLGAKHAQAGLFGLGFVDGFVVTPKTLLGRARIQVTTSKTLTGLARIQFVNTKNLLGQARVQLLTNRTLLGRSRIQVTSTQALLGRSRVQSISSQALLGVARVILGAIVQQPTNQRRTFIMSNENRTLGMIESRVFTVLGQPSRLVDQD